MGHEVVLNGFGEFFTFHSLAGDNMLQVHEDVLYWVFAFEQFAQGIGASIERAVIKCLQVAKVFEHFDELFGQFVLVVHVGDQVIVFGLDVGVKLQSVLHMILI